MFEIIHIIKIGLVAGVVMGMTAMIFKLVKFTNLDLTTYMGCLITGKPAGTINFIAGFAFHLLTSGILALIYAFFIIILHLHLTLRTGIMLGTIHTLISGCIMPLLDRMNHCVKQNNIAALGLLTINYGLHSVITFFIGHIIYAIVVIELLA